MPQTCEICWDERVLGDSSLEESGFELMVPPRTERKWEGAGTHQHHLGRASELKVLPNLSSDTWDQEFDPFPPSVSPVRTTGSGATAPGTARALGERRKRLVCGSSPSELRSYLVTRVPPGHAINQPSEAVFDRKNRIEFLPGPMSSMIDRKCERD